MKEKKKVKVLCIATSVVLEVEKVLVSDYLATKEYVLYTDEVEKSNTKKKK